MSKSWIADEIVNGFIDAVAREIERRNGENNMEREIKVGSKWKCACGTKSCNTTIAVWGHDKYRDSVRCMPLTGNADHVYYSTAKFLERFEEIVEPTEEEFPPERMAEATHIEIAGERYQIIGFNDKGEVMIYDDGPYTTRIKHLKDPKFFKVAK